MKNNVLYSIPCVAALLLIGSLTILSSYPTYAKVPIATENNGDDANTATASISLSNPDMTSNAVVPGEVAIASTNVTVEVSNAESYSLTLSVDNANLTNGSTTLVPGNAIADNTWGYKWDNASTYTAPSTTGTTLATPALTDNAVSFTKTLTFGAKFATNADAGTYHGSGKLSLAATPKQITVTLANLTQMQQLSQTPEACANTPYQEGQNYSIEYTLTDARDNKNYTVRKFGDGRCWMTSELKLGKSSPTTLSVNDTNIKRTYTLPAKTEYGSDWSNSNTNWSENEGLYWYQWSVATAGTGLNITGAQTATSSICPKGWTLPTGGTGGEFDKLLAIYNIPLGVANEAATKVFDPPLSFSHTGSYIPTLGGNGHSGSGSGTYWSSTSSESGIYYTSLSASGGIVNGIPLYMGANSVTATGSVSGHGFAIRCISLQ